MTKFILSGVVPKGNTASGAVKPDSVLALFGHKPVRDHWSGLYGTTSTRLGLKWLLQSAGQSMGIFRAICEVPGPIATRISEDDLDEFGYLNVRYADANLLAKIESCWKRLASLNDAETAINTRPDLAADVAEALGMGPLVIIIHPVRIKNSPTVVSVATVLDTACIKDIRSREPGLHLTW